MFSLGKRSFVQLCDFRKYAESELQAKVAASDVYICLAGKFSTMSQFVPLL